MGTESAIRSISSFKKESYGQKSSARNLWCSIRIVLLQG